MGLLEINSNIQKQLESGKSREKIFQELTRDSPANAPKLAYSLASIPYESLRSKYLKHNALLFIFLVMLAGLSLAAEWPIDFQQSTIFIVIKILIPLVFSYFVYHFHGGVYRLLGIWCIIDLFESLLLLDFTTGVGLSKMAVLIALIFLAFYIAVKVFPNLGILGPNKDSQGRYLV
jgi:hypothetical protein